MIMGPGVRGGPLYSETRQMLRSVVREMIPDSKSTPPPSAAASSSTSSSASSNQAHLPRASAPEAGEKGSLSLNFSCRCLLSASPRGDSGSFCEPFCSFPKNLAVSHDSIAMLRASSIPYNVRIFFAVSLLGRVASA